MEKQNKRLFIGVRPSQQICEKIGGSMKELQMRLSEAPSTPSTLKVNWVQQENYHLTLKFLGGVSNILIPDLNDSLGKSLTQFSSFEIQVKGMGTFPPRGTPKILWADVHDPSNSLSKIAQDLDLLLTQEPFLFERESKPFTAHLTLARVKQGRLPVNWNDLLVQNNWGSCPIDQVILFESETKSQGPIYKTIASFPLTF